MSYSSPHHPIDVVICVHNSLDDVIKCLTSVKLTLRSGDRLIIVDDGSAEETKLFCEHFSSELGFDACKLIRRPEGSGFCRAANAGLRASTSETVIILNSDTIVVGDWISRLTGCMTSNWQIGIVGPLSNAGGWQSIPEFPGSEKSGQFLSCDIETLSEIHQFCSTFGTRFAPPLVEQINGFCYAVSREVLSKVGFFDEESFPMGYGEESDLTIRALDAGFLCAIATDCFVYHARTKSYTPEVRAKHNKLGQEKLATLHGRHRISQAVAQTQAHKTLEAIRGESRKVFSEMEWWIA